MGKELNVSASSTPSELLRIAVEQNADIDKLSKLMELQERWEANEARKAYHAALSAFKAVPVNLGKNRHVSFRNKAGTLTEYDHATLDSICEVLGKPLGEQGLSFTWTTEQKDSVVSVTCHLTHFLGHSEKTTLYSPPDNSGGKNSIQGIGSVVTYLQRYTLRAITGTAEAGSDDDGAASEPVVRIANEQALEIHATITENDIDMARFLKWLKRSTKAESIEDIALKVLPAVLRQLDQLVKRT